MSPLAVFCVEYYALAILSGARATVVSGRSDGDLVFDGAMALCLGIWALADARQRQETIPRSQKIWFFAFAGLVVPGYVIITRGWKGLGWLVFYAVSWSVIASLAMHATGFLYFGEAWWRALGFGD